MALRSNLRLVKKIKQGKVSPSAAELRALQDDKDAFVDDVIQGLRSKQVVQSINVNIEKVAASARKLSPEVESLSRQLEKNTIREISGDEIADFLYPDDEIPQTVSRPVVEKAHNDFTIKTYRVTGMQHYLDSIMELASENPDYDMTKREIIDACMTDEKIWKYDFYSTKTELVPEPDNPYDPNAVMVRVSGKLIGYIKAGSCKHILNLLKDERIKGIDCDIDGGPYKMVEEDDDGKYILSKGNANFSVRLTIYEKSAK